jgi:hypothetical protein
MDGKHWKLHSWRVCGKEYNADGTRMGSFKRRYPIKMGNLSESGKR